MDLRVFLTLLLCSGWPAGLQGSVGRCSGEPSCKVTRVHGMKTADCYRLELKKIPKCLTGDAEVIDLSYNRIREITATDLKKFRNLKFLYLSENMITKIDPEAFADKTDLQTLDLSYNGFSKPLPDVIFHLPSLKNLYLSQNQNINIIEILENAVPITSPLVKLDISYNNFEEYENPQKLPNLGIMEHLVVYNVSGMDLVMQTGDVAGLCNLQRFVTDNVTASFEDPCECWRLEAWLMERKVVFTSFKCATTGYECDYTIPEEDSDQFSACRKQHTEKIFQSKLNNIFLIVGCVICVLLLVLLIVLYKWRKVSIKKRKARQAIIKKEYHQRVDL